MAASCGAVVGNTWTTATVPVPLTNGGLVSAMPSVPASATANRSMVVAAAAGPSGRSTARISGPLKPGPKPSATRSKARRAVSVSGRLPASPNPSRIDSAGVVSTRISARPAAAIDAGRRCTTRLHRYQSEAFLGRRAGSRRTDRWSILRPTTPNRAGSSVSEASTATSTPAEVELQRLEIGHLARTSTTATVEAPSPAAQRLGEQFSYSKRSTSLCEQGAPEHLCCGGHGSSLDSTAASRHRSRLRNGVIILAVIPRV